MRKLYLILFFGTVIVASAFVFLFIAWANPYRLYGWNNPSEINSLKPRPSAYLYEVKMANFLASSSDSVILGNSRADIGFDPESPAWSARSLEPYTLAIPGTGVTTIQMQIADIFASGRKIKMATVGIDFLDFLVKPDPVADAGRALELPRKSALADWRWRLDTAFSVNALKDAFQALLINKKENPAAITAKGANPLFDYRAAARQEGYYAIFRQRAQENARNYSARPRAVVHTDGKPSRQMATLEASLDNLASEGAEVALVIYPYHAQILAMWDVLGLTDTFLQWKEEMVRLVARVQSRHPSAVLRLWDFSGFHSYACEPIPKMGDHISETRWYWEAGHFKKELGDLMLGRILSPENSNKDGEQANFGTILNAATLKKFNSKLEAERALCRKTQPGLFTEVTQLLQASKYIPQVQ